MNKGTIEPYVGCKVRIVGGMHKGMVVKLYHKHSDYVFWSACPELGTAIFDVYSTAFDFEVIEDDGNSE